MNELQKKDASSNKRKERSDRTDGEGYFRGDGRRYDDCRELAQEQFK